MRWCVHVYAFMSNTVQQVNKCHKSSHIGCDACVRVGCAILSLTTALLCLTGATLPFLPLPSILPLLQVSISASAEQDDKLGHPVSVLVGHQGPVTYVDFNRSVPNALLSSSFDGTCRIWDATNSAWPAKVMPACPSFGPMKGVTRFGGLPGPSNPSQSNKPNTRSLQEPGSSRTTPVDAANASLEQRLRSSDPTEAAAASAAADQVGPAGD